MPNKNSIEFIKDYASLPPTEKDKIDINSIPILKDFYNLSPDEQEKAAMGFGVDYSSLKKKDDTGKTVSGTYQESDVQKEKDFTSTVFQPSFSGMRGDGFSDTISNIHGQNVKKLSPSSAQFYQQTNDYDKHLNDFLLAQNQLWKNKGVEASPSNELLGNAPKIKEEDTVDVFGSNIPKTQLMSEEGLLTQMVDAKKSMQISKVVGDFNSYVTESGKDVTTLNALDYQDYLDQKYSPDKADLRKKNEDFSELNKVEREQNAINNYANTLTLKSGDIEVAIKAKYGKDFIENYDKTVSSLNKLYDTVNNKKIETDKKIEPLLAELAKLKGVEGVKTQEEANIINTRQNELANEIKTIQEEYNSDKEVSTFQNQLAQYNKTTENNTELNEWLKIQKAQEENYNRFANLLDKYPKADETTERWDARQKAIDKRFAKNAFVNQLDKGQYNTKRYIIGALSRMIEGLFTLPRTIEQAVDPNIKSPFPGVNVDPADRYGWADWMANVGVGMNRAIQEGLPRPTKLSRRVFQKEADVDGFKVLYEKNDKEELEPVEVRDSRYNPVEKKEAVRILAEEAIQIDREKDIKEKFSLTVLFDRGVEATADVGVMLLGANKYGNAFKALGASQKTASFAGVGLSLTTQTHNQAYNEGLNSGLTEDEAGKYAIATSLAITTSSLVLSPVEAKLAAGSKGVGLFKNLFPKGSLKLNPSDIAKLRGEVGLQGVLLGKFKTALSEASKEVVEESLIEESLTNINNYVFNEISGNRAKLSTSINMAELKEIAAISFLPGFSMGWFSGKKRPQYQQEALQRAIDNPSAFSDLMYAQLSEGSISIEDYNATNERVGNITQKMLPFKDSLSSDDQRQLSSLFDIKYGIEKELEIQEDSAVQETYKEKLDLIDSEIKMLLKGEPVASNFVQTTREVTAGTRNQAGEIQQESEDSTSSSDQKKTAVESKPIGDFVGETVEYKGKEVTLLEDEDSVIGEDAEGVKEVISSKEINVNEIKGIKIIGGSSEFSALSEQELAKEIKTKAQFGERVFTSKNQKYNLHFKKGNLELVDAEGNIADVSSTTKRAYINEYKDDFDYSTGKTILEKDASLQFETVEQLDDHIVNESDNPAEILDAMASREKYIPETEFDFIERAIANIISKVKRSSFIQFGDKNDIEFSMAKKFFSKEGLGIDEISQEASAFITDDYDATNQPVSTDDVVDYIKKYAKSDFWRQKDSIYSNLEDRFTQLTGFKPNSKDFQNAEAKRKEKEQRGRLEEDTGIPEASQTAANSKGKAQSAPGQGESEPTIEQTKEYQDLAAKEELIKAGFTKDNDITLFVGVPEKGVLESEASKRLRSLDLNEKEIPKERFPRGWIHRKSKELTLKYLDRHKDLELAAKTMLDDIYRQRGLKTTSPQALSVMSAAMEVMLENLIKSKSKELSNVYTQEIVTWRSGIAGVLGTGFINPSRFELNQEISDIKHQREFILTKPDLSGENLKTKLDTAKKEIDQEAKDITKTEEFKKAVEEAVKKAVKGMRSKTPRKPMKQAKIKASQQRFDAAKLEFRKRIRKEIGKTTALVDPISAAQLLPPLAKMAKEMVVQGYYNTSIIAEGIWAEISDSFDNKKQFLTLFNEMLSKNVEGFSDLLSEEVVDSLKERMANAIKSHEQQGEGETNFDSVLLEKLAKALILKYKSENPKSKSKTEKDYLAEISERVDLKKDKELWDGAFEILTVFIEADITLDDTTKAFMLSRVSQYISSVIGQPFRDSEIKKAVSQNVEDIAGVINSLVKKHYNVTSKNINSLAQKIVSEVDVTPETAKIIEEAIVSELSKRLSTRAKNLVAALNAPRGKEEKLLALTNSLNNAHSDPARKVIEEKISKLLHGSRAAESIVNKVVALGHLDNNNDYYDLFSERYGLKKLSSKDIEILDRLSYGVSQTEPGSMFRERLLKDFENYMITLNSNSRISFAKTFFDTIKESYYANLLSSLFTNTRNIIGGLFSAGEYVFMSSLTNPKTVFNIYKNAPKIDRKNHSGVDEFVNAFIYGDVQHETFAGKGKIADLTNRVMNHEKRKLLSPTEKIKLFTIGSPFWAPALIIRSLSAFDALFRGGVKNYIQKIKAYNRVLKETDRYSAEFWDRYLGEMYEDKVGQEIINDMLNSELAALQDTGINVSKREARLRREEIRLDLMGKLGEDIRRSSFRALLQDPHSSTVTLLANKLQQGINGAAKDMIDSGIKEGSLIKYSSGRTINFFVKSIIPFIRVPFGALALSLSWSPLYAVPQWIKSFIPGIGKGPTISPGLEYDEEYRQILTARMMLSVGATVILLSAMFDLEEDEKTGKRALVLNKKFPIKFYGNNQEMSKTQKFGEMYVPNSIVIERAGSKPVIIRTTETPFGIFVATIGNLSDEIRLAHQIRRRDGIMSKDFEKIQRGMVGSYFLSMVGSHTSYLAEQRYMQGMSAVIELISPSGHLRDSEQANIKSFNGVMDVVLKPAKSAVPVLSANLLRDPYKIFTPESQRKAKLGKHGWQGFKEYMMQGTIIEPLIKRQNNDAFGYPLYMRRDMVYNWIQSKDYPEYKFMSEHNLNSGGYVNATQNDKKALESNELTKTLNSEIRRKNYTSRRNISDFDRLSFLESEYANAFGENLRDIIAIKAVKTASQAQQQKLITEIRSISRDEVRFQYGITKKKPKKLSKLLKQIL